jgi:hypothetical protein
MPRSARPVRYRDGHGQHHRLETEPDGRDGPRRSGPVLAQLEVTPASA